MKCQKVQRLNVDLAFLLSSIQDSQDVETNPQGDLIRRKDNKLVPPIAIGQDTPLKKVKGSAEVVGIVYKVETIKSDEEV
jgi:hypothetical protein